MKQLTCVDLNRVHHQWLHVVSVSFNDSHLVAIDGKDEIGIARDRDEAEAVAENPVRFQARNNMIPHTEQTYRSPGWTLTTARSVAGPPG